MAASSGQDLTSVVNPLKLVQAVILNKPYDDTLSADASPVRADGFALDDPPPLSDELNEPLLSAQYTDLLLQHKAAGLPRPAVEPSQSSSLAPASSTSQGPIEPGLTDPALATQDVTNAMFGRGVLWYILIPLAAAGGAASIAAMLSENPWVIGGAALTVGGAAAAAGYYTEE